MSAKMAAIVAVALAVAMLATMAGPLAPASATSAGTIAYLGSDGALFLVKSNGAGLTRIATHMYGNRLFWSPDGTRIAAQQGRYDRAWARGVKFEQVSTRHVAVMDLAGIPDGVFTYFQCFSPNGKQAVVTDDGGTGYLVDTGTGARSTLASGTAWCWSGDGTRIWYFQYGALYRMDLPSRTITFVTGNGWIGADHELGTEIAVAPGDTRIAVNVWPADFQEGEVWWVPVDGSAPKKQKAAYGRVAAVSATGRYLATVAAADKRVVITDMAHAHSVAMPVKPGVSFWHYPSFSPGSSWVCMERATAPSSGVSDVWRYWGYYMTVSGGSFGMGPANAYSPVFRPTF